MLEAILTGQAKSIGLLGAAIGLFLYFLPTALSFLKGQKRFWLVLLLNLVLTFVQSLVFQYVFPDFLTPQPGNFAATMRVSLLVNFGPGWIALLVWVLTKDETDARLLRAQQTKYYDAVTALPLILWFVYGTLQIRPILVGDGSLILAGTASLFVWVQFFSLLAAAAFDLLLVYLLIVRDRPVGKSKGVLPRLFGFVGTFLGVGILQLPVAHLSLGMQILAAVLIGIGSLASFLVLWRLGKSFSIMPEARKLVTVGPYAWARHPLYAVEMITVAGTALQFQAPGAWLIALVVVMLLLIRSHYEEQVLAENFPEYGEYRARTKRFIPGVI
jgi:protein-S-isoprenylcysteine O-methyltransferase Ste14